MNAATLLAAFGCSADGAPPIPPQNGAPDAVGVRGVTAGASVPGLLGAPAAGVSGSAGAGTVTSSVGLAAGTPALARAGTVAPPPIFPSAGGMASAAPSGAAGAAGTASPAVSSGPGTAPKVGTQDISSCPAAPADAPADAVAALNSVNMMRLKTGAGCMRLAPELDKSATSHCSYNAMNTDAMCMPGGHTEVMSCMGFTGADVLARVKAAGYTGYAGVTEVLTQGGTPDQAVMGWIDTLWHRIPMLDPWTTDMGWGAAKGCDIIDFGAGTMPAAKDLVTVYPYDGQTNFPTSFNGLESPEPPKPSSGWPSSSFISVYAQGLKVTEHTLTKDGDATPLEHLWVDKNSMEIDAGYRGYLAIIAFMYGAKPFDANTKYHVKVAGMHTGGTFNVEWSFTTGAAARAWP